MRRKAMAFLMFGLSALSAIVTASVTATAAEPAATSPVAAKKIQITASNLRERVEARNACVAAAKAEIDAAGSRAGYLTRSFLPSLELYAAGETLKLGSQDTKSEPTYGAELKVNLLNGGRDQAVDAIRKLEVEKRTSLKVREAAEILERARHQFFEILFLQEKLKNIAESVALNSQNLTAAQRRIKSGLATDSDRFEFEMRDVDLRRERAQAELQILQVRNELGVLLALAPEEDLQISEGLTHDHDYEASLQAGEKEMEFLFKPELLDADQGLKAAEAEGAELWPRLDAYAAYNQFNERDKEFPEARDRSESVVGLRVSMSLGRGLESRSEAKALRQESEALKLRADLLRRESLSFIVRKRAELKMLHDQVHEAEENIVRAERYYKLTQSEYGRGVKNSPDVLGAAEKLYDREQRRLEIVRDFQMAKAEVLSKLGR